MNSILLAVVILVAFAVFALLVKKFAGRDHSQTDVYYLKKTLFSPAERSFLGVLEAQLPAGVRVFGKVRLEDFFGVTSGLERGHRQAARNRINRKHVDFLLVRTNDLAPLAGIELDDSSHDAENRKERDAFVDGAFASAGLPLLHVPAQKAYNLAELKTKIVDLLKTTEAPNPPRIS